MKYLSLFSGIGGFELGIQQAYEQIQNDSETGRCGQEESLSERLMSDISSESNKRQCPTCIGYSEIDKYAIATYQKHYPTHHNYGDITKINADELPNFDLLVGGFPCQAFSIAGKRKGFEDTRGTLFFEIARILKAKQPRLFCLENVKGLLSHNNGNTFRTIVSTLNELGYDLQWQVLNSKNFGVPQNRERVFIIGHLRGTSRPEVFPFTLSANENNDRINGAGITARPLYKDSKRELQWSRTNISNTLKASGQTDTATTFIEHPKIRRLTPTECERLQGFPETEKYAILEICKQVNANGVEIVLNTKVTDQENVAQVDVLIDCVENGVEIHSQGRLLLNAKNVEKKNWYHPLIKIDDFVQLLVGINTIKEKVVRLGEVELHQNEQSLTHQTNGKKQENLYGKEMMLPVADVKNDLTTLNELLKYITSNLSSTENLEQKLQTLSLFVIRAINGYIPNETLNQDTFTIGVKTSVGYTYGGSDTQRYKQCGNAVTVNVIRDIMIKLVHN